jgi:uncharacterized protein YndB with AHSA1/START domain
MTKSDLPGRATTTRTTFSRQTSVSVEIKASATTVWNLLTDASQYPSWNATVISIDGSIELGKKIRLKSTLDPKRVFKLTVKEYEWGKRLVWGDKQGDRTYSLRESNGTIMFSMTEKIGGLMFPLYAKMIPSFDESFERFARDLKNAAEKK